ncbi:hypothetical protein [Mangrovicoccus sp. HB161399]|uniref:hypothetical protein n=1 Tax=Mangrovicoccus sp. HB161399 TaxID=2720392 RepID=UPI001552FE19|nr:hypothetical protein [Mangrovicoccus sp. HB161399]
MFPGGFHAELANVSAPICAREALACRIQPPRLAAAILSIPFAVYLSFLPGMVICRR